MSVIPYLFFNGACREAVTFYGQVFGTEPEIMPFAAMPEEEKAQMPGVPDDAVMHATVTVGGSPVFASDSPSGPSDAMAGCRISVTCADAAETKRVFEALSVGGTVDMSLMPMFWSEAFGQVTDMFSTRWMAMAEGAEA